MYLPTGIKQNSSEQIPSAFLKRTKIPISSATFGRNDVEKISQDLDPNNAHGHNNSQHPHA